MSVATVNEGVITAVKSGETQITVKSEDGGKTATCTVIVSDKIYPVESVGIDKTSVELIEGDEVILTVTVNPDNATNKNMMWSSSDMNVATVTDGKVTAVKSGKATITVKSEDGGKTASCEINQKVRKMLSPRLILSQFKMVNFSNSPIIMRM